MKPRLLTGLLGALLVVLLTGASFVTPSNPVPQDSLRIYVTTTGSDASGSPGFADRPYRTLGAAASNAVSGTVIHLSAGHWHVTNSVRMPHGVSLKGESADVTWIHNWVPASVGINPGSSSTFSDFSITNRLGLTLQACFGIEANADGNSRGFTNVTVNNVSFYGETDLLWKVGENHASTWTFNNCFFWARWDLFTQNYVDDPSTFLTWTIFNGCRFLFDQLGSVADGLLVTNAVIFNRTSTERVQVVNSVVEFTNILGGGATMMTQIGGDIAQVSVINYNNCTIHSTVPITMFVPDVNAPNRIMNYNECSLNGMPLAVPQMLVPLTQLTNYTLKIHRPENYVNMTNAVRFTAVSGVTTNSRIHVGVTLTNFSGANRELTFTNTWIPMGTYGTTVTNGKQARVDFEVDRDFIRYRLFIQP